MSGGGSSGQNEENGLGFCMRNWEGRVEGEGDCACFVFLFIFLMMNYHRYS